MQQEAIATWNAVRVLLLSSVVWAIASPMYGQGNFGTIRGRVQDPSGAVLVGASVVSANEQTGVQTKTVTGPAGEYAFSLAIGSYSITTTFSGFRTLIQTGVRVVSGQSQTLDLTLQVGQTAQTVQVAGSAPLLNALANVAGTTRVTEEISDLPLALSGNTRSATDFVMTVSGINWNPGATGSNDLIAVGAINGAPGGMSGYYIDGLEANKTNYLAEDYLNPMPEAMDEFQITTGINAEYGWNSGSGVALVSKSGTNALHGSVFEYVRNDDLNARSFLAKTVPFDKQNEFGIAVGGPVVLPKIYNGRNRTFFFATYDGFRYHYQVAPSLLSVPTALMRQGDFSELLGDQIGTDVLGRPIYIGEIYDPATTRPDGQGGFVRDPFNYQGKLNAISPSEFSPISLGFLKGYPLPNSPGVANNYAAPSPATPTTIDRISFKFDQAVGSGHRLAFSYEDNLRYHFGGGFNALDPTINPGTNYNYFMKRYRLTWTWNLKPNVVLAARVGLQGTHGRVYTIAGLPSANYGAQVGLKGVITPQTPRVSITGFTGFGPNWLTMKNYETVVPFSADVTWIKGKHSIKFGDQHSNAINPYDFFLFGAGVFNFNPLETGLPGVTSTGSGMVSYMLGTVDNAQMQSENVTRYKNATNGMYIQDQWRATSKLTVNYGIRWDVFQPVTEKADKLSPFDPTVPNPAAGGRLGALTFWGTGPGRNGRHAFNDTYYGAFTPRLGLAYALNSKTVLRASYGLSSVALQGIYGGGYDAPFSGWTVNLTPSSTDNGVTPAFNWTNGFPLSVPPLPNTNPSLVNGNSTNYVNPRDSKPGRTQNINAGIQRELPGNMVLRMDYIGTLSHGIPVDQLIELNTMNPSYLSLGNLLLANVYSAEAQAAGIKVPYPGFNGSVAQALRPYPQYLDIDYQGSRNGFVEYNSFQLNIQKRMKNGLTMLVAYTLSKTLGNAFFTNQGWGYSLVQAQDQIRAAKALDTLDRPQSLAVSYVYHLPFGPGQRFARTQNPILKRLVGGWEVSGIHNYYGGLPLQVRNNGTLPGGLGGYTLAGGVNGGAFSGHVWSNRVLGVPIKNMGCGGYTGNPATPYLNISAFTTPAPFTFGNTFVLPNTRSCASLNESLSVVKTISIRETAGVKLGANFFNAFNRHQWTGLQTNIDIPSSYGLFTGTSNGRSIQFYAKLEF